MDKKVRMLHMMSALAATGAMMSHGPTPEERAANAKQAVDTHRSIGAKNFQKQKKHRKDVAKQRRKNRKK